MDDAAIQDCCPEIVSLDEKFDPIWQHVAELEDISCVMDGLCKACSSYELAFALIDKFKQSKVFTALRVVPRNNAKNLACIEAAIVHGAKMRNGSDLLLSMVVSGMIPNENLKTLVESLISKNVDLSLRRNEHGYNIIHSFLSAGVVSRPIYELLFTKYPILIHEQVNGFTIAHATALGRAYGSKEPINSFVQSFVPNYTEIANIVSERNGTCAHIACRYFSKKEFINSAAELAKLDFLKLWKSKVPLELIPISYGTLEQVLSIAPTTFAPQNIWHGKITIDVLCSERMWSIYSTFYNIPVDHLLEMEHPVHKKPVFQVLWDKIAALDPFHYGKFTTIIPQLEKLMHRSIFLELAMRKQFASLVANTRRIAQSSRYKLDIAQVIHSCAIHLNGYFLGHLIESYRYNIFNLQTPPTVPILSQRRLKQSVKKTFNVQYKCEICNKTVECFLHLQHHYESKAHKQKEHQQVNQATQQ